MPIYFPLVSITIFLEGLNRRKTGAEIKAFFRVPKAFSMDLSHFHSLAGRQVELVSGLIILEKSFINRR